MFSFPPPPRPPSPQSASTSHNQNATNQFSRGRGARGSFRARGRGGFRGGSARGQNIRGSQYASRPRGDYSLPQSTQRQLQQTPVQPSDPQFNSYGAQTSAGNYSQGHQNTQAYYNPNFLSFSPPAKQHNQTSTPYHPQPLPMNTPAMSTYTGAFNSYGRPHPHLPSQSPAFQRNTNQPSNTVGKKRRHEHLASTSISPEVSPAVPSFGLSLPSKPDWISTPHDGSRKRSNKKPRKYNQFGLTPRADEHEESEDDDVDEEATNAHLGTE